MSRPDGRLDHDEVSRRLFYPRPDPGFGPPPGSRDLSIQVDTGVALHARLHAGADGGPICLFFHGNGEIAADYDEVAPLYRELGAALMVIDYRGYGRSAGTPTASALIADAEAVLSFVGGSLAAQRPARIVLVGRSLGSAPAIHLAATRGDEVAGLILESGFARTTPLLRLVGAPIERLAIGEEHGFGNAASMRDVRVPTLLLHASHDSIIPIDDARANLDACAARSKSLVVIEGADHNSIMLVGGARYWGAIRDFLAGVGAAPRF